MAASRAGDIAAQDFAKGLDLLISDATKSKTVKTLAGELHADPTLLYRLLRAHAAIGLLEEDGSLGFVLTDEGELLRSERRHDDVRRQLVTVVEI